MADILQAMCSNVVVNEWNVSVLITLMAVLTRLVESKQRLFTKPVSKPMLAHSWDVLIWYKPTPRCVILSPGIVTA